MVFPGHASHYNNRAKAYSDQGDYEKSLADYDAAILLSAPKSAGNFMGRGHCHYMLKEYDIALAIFKKSIQVAQNASGQWLAVARFYSDVADKHRKQGELQEAEEAHSQAIKILEEDESEASFARATVYEDLGDFDKVHGELNRMLEDRKNYNNVAWFLVTCSNSRLRDPKRAVALAREAVSRNNSHDFWNTLGVALYQAEDFEGAIKALNTSIQKLNGVEPKEIDLLPLAMAQWKLGQKDEALRSYRKCLASIDPRTGLMFPPWESPSVRKQFWTEAGELFGIAGDDGADGASASAGAGTEDNSASQSPNRSQADGAGK